MGFMDAVLLVWLAGLTFLFFALAKCVNLNATASTKASEKIDRHFTVFSARLTALENPKPAERWVKTTDFED